VSNLISICLSCSFVTYPEEASTDLVQFLEYFLRGYDHIHDVGWR
jgi:hypothetical protein